MSAVRLSVAVMAHPSRSAAAGRLIESLDGVPRLVLDPAAGDPPHTLRTAIEAWDARPAGATHHLVLQDDVVPAAGFLSAVEAAAARLPDAVLAFYAHWNAWNGATTRLAVRCGRAWSEMVPLEYVPTVALLLPAALAGEFVSFARRRQAQHLPDDHAMAALVRARRPPAYVAAPNLVDHDDPPSLVGNSVQGPRHSPCMLPSCEVHARSTGILRLRDIKAVPVLVRGEPLALVQHAPGRWGRTHWQHARLDLDLREPLLWRTYARARAGLPGDVRSLFAGFHERLLSSVWIAAYLDGAIAAGLGGRPVSAEAAHRATECLVLSGLMHCLPQPDIDRRLAALARFAAAGTAAGGRDVSTAAPDRPEAGSALPESFRLSESMTVRTEGTASAPDAWPLS